MRTRFLKRPTKYQQKHVSKNSTKLYVGSNFASDRNGKIFTMRMLEIRPTNNFRGASNQLNWKFPTLGQHDAEIIISGSEKLKMFEGEKSKKK